MLSRAFHKLSSAHFIAIVALFVALGGTASATSVIRAITGQQIQKGTITGANIKAHTISERQIARHSITGTEIRVGSLQATDFNNAQAAKLRGLSGNAGARGVQGVAGPAGPAGTPGAPGSLPSFSASGNPITNYVNLTPIVSITVPTAGVYVAIASGTYTNTGAVDDNGVGCGIAVDGAITDAAGFSVAAGATISTGPIVSVAAPNTSNDVVSLECQGSGVTTFNLSGFTMKLVKLSS